MTRNKHDSNFKRGQKLPADWANDVARSLNDENQPGLLKATQPYGYAPLAVAPFTVYEFDLDATNTLHRDRLLSLQVKVPDPASRELVTFGERSVLANVPAPLVVLAPGMPYLIQAAAAPNAPVKGEECGVHNGGVVMDNRGSGFTAINAPFTQGTMSLVWVRFNSSGSAGSAYYKLAEDWLPTRNWIYAYPCDRLGTISSTTPIQLKYIGNLLRYARVGLVVLANRIDGLWEAAQVGDCISTTCKDSTATVSGNEPPIGTVGEAYNFAIAVSNLSSAISASNLPPGILLDGNDLDGEPTTAGTWYVVITGPKTHSGATCNVTRMLKVVVNEAP